VQGQATAWQGKIVDGAGSATAMVATSLEKLDPSTSRSPPALEPSEGEQDERDDERTDRVKAGSAHIAVKRVAFPRFSRGSERLLWIGELRLRPILGCLVTLSFTSAL
jgi:hypothetical protein